LRSETLKIDHGDGKRAALAAAPSLLISGC
jgi:hypothetical protein